MLVFKKCAIYLTEFLNSLKRQKNSVKIEFAGFPPNLFKKTSFCVFCVCRDCHRVWWRTSFCRSAHGEHHPTGYQHFRCSPIWSGRGGQWNQKLIGMAFENPPLSLIITGAGIFFKARLWRKKIMHLIAFFRLFETISRIFKGNSRHRTNVVLGQKIKTSKISTFGCMDHVPAMPENFSFLRTWPVIAKILRVHLCSARGKFCHEEFFKHFKAF